MIFLFYFYNIWVILLKYTKFALSCTHIYAHSCNSIHLRRRKKTNSVIGSINYSALVIEGSITSELNAKFGFLFYVVEMKLQEKTNDHHLHFESELWCIHHYSSVGLFKNIYTSKTGVILVDPISIKVTLSTPTKNWYR